MREKRNAALVVVLFLAFCWVFWAWLMQWHETGGTIWIHRLVAVSILLFSAGLLFWSMKFEDRLPDHLAEYTGGVYYERSGLCFMPVMRKDGDRAYFCIYYQNRYDSPVEAIVHLRPPEGTIQHRPDANDIHFAFICPGGGVGLIQQPVAVHPKLQGQTVDVRMAAAVNYRHNRGQQLRSNRGIPCGTFEVDWGINFRTGMHQLSGELELFDPVVVHVPIPRGVSNRIRAGEQWKQETLFVPEQ